MVRAGASTAVVASRRQSLRRRSCGVSMIKMILNLSEYMFCICGACELTGKQAIRAGDRRTGGRGDGSGLSQNVHHSDEICYREHLCSRSSESRGPCYVDHTDWGTSAAVAIQHVSASRSKPAKEEKYGTADADAQDKHHNHLLCLKKSSSKRPRSPELDLEEEIRDLDISSISKLPARRKCTRIASFNSAPL